MLKDFSGLLGFRGAQGYRPESFGFRAGARVGSVVTGLTNISATSVLSQLTSQHHYTTSKYMCWIGFGDEIWEVDICI